MKPQKHKRGSVYVCAVCGAPASFGRNVNRWAHGDWYCRKHWSREDD